MKISLNWLKDYVSVPISAEKLGEMLTLHTAEVEEVVDQGKGLEGVVVGELVEIKKHPNANKLSLATVNIGEKKPIHLIFGQMVKMKAGYKVPVAVAPTTLPTGLVIEKKELRGAPSEGMLCLDQELGFKEEGTSIQFFDKNVMPGTPLAEALSMNDKILEIDNKSLTHRPDLWGHYGIAREVAALLGEKLKKIEPIPPAPCPMPKLSIEIKDKDLCPRYLGVKITGVKVEESPKWLRKKLEAAGHATYNNIVDITNFIASELGQPMHAFDARLIEGGIIVRTAKKDEKFTTLDGTEHKLSDKNLVIADHKKAVALAGVMGGQNSEIQKDTTEIIFEAANFDAVSVRKTSTELGLRTESVQRFEKSLDPALAELAMLRAIQLLLEICPSAKLASPITDENFSKPKNLKIKIDPEKVASKIGAPISKQEIKKILESLEFKVSPSFEVSVPSFRSTKDIEGEDDIVEEVARIFGYENIPPSFPNLPPKLPMENRERFLKHKARDILSLGMGFSEVSNYSFYSEKDFQKYKLPEKEHLKLKNCLSEDQTHMRTSLLPNMLKSKTRKVYEIGRTYKEIGEFMPLEEKWILGLLAEGFFAAKGAAEAFLEKFGAVTPKIVESKNPPAYTHPQKCATILIKGKEVGQIYEVHPGIAENTAVFEINFTALVASGQRQHKYSSLPKFPSLELDISVVLPEKITAAEAEKAIEKADKKLIKQIELFDIYRGKGLETSEKALAYHIELRADDRTLTDEEMTAVQKQVFKNLESLGGKIRGKAA
ncbi:phenylalanine--tRNA ligase subunit beta [Patescibacteria group bacterium]|nr:phenylalanine--tRNA ligase subunit beta [Patescibacteria group bacterium]